MSNSFNARSPSQCKGCTVSSEAKEGIRNRLNRLTVYALAASFALMLGCSSTPSHTTDSISSSGAEPVPNIELLGQFQLPPGAKVINDRTLILGAGDSWVGRITMEVGKDTNLAYSFFMEQYPKQGWTLQSAARGSSSLIVFAKQDRNASIEIRDASFALSATAVLTVTPRSNPVTPVSTPAANTAGANTQGAGGSISGTPLPAAAAGASGRN